MMRLFGQYSGTVYQEGAISASKLWSQAEGALSIAIAPSKLWMPPSRQTKAVAPSKHARDMAASKQASSIAIATLNAHQDTQRTAQHSHFPKQSNKSRSYNLKKISNLNIFDNTWSSPSQIYSKSLFVIF